MKKLFALILLAGLATAALQAQPWLPNAAETPSSEGWSNYYDLKKAFDSWFESRDQGKGTGYKQFQRYLAFLEPRVYPSGEFPQDALWKAYQAKDSRLKTGSVTAQWEPIGPFDYPPNWNGVRQSGIGRINCITFHPTDPNIIYVGAPSGGVWKTVNGGNDWVTHTDQLPGLGVSDIGINPLNPDILYMVTGDKDGGNTCPTYSFGILKSTDAGVTWESTGLVHDIGSNHRMRRILVHPVNPDILITAGSPGLYRSEDAGTNWTQIQSGNYFDLEFMPGNPSVVYACTGSMIYKSTDAGLTFERVTEGLPTTGIGRTEMAVTNANPNVIYAVMSNSGSGFKGLYKSSDAGLTWATQSTEASINIFSYDATGSGNTGIAWYAIALAIDQQDENIVYSGSVNLWRSMNSGTGWDLVAHWYGGFSKPYVHADEHVLVVNPVNNVCYSGNDGGIYKTLDKGTTWTDISSTLAILQVYRMGASYTNPDLILEGSQDNGTYLYKDGEWIDVYGGDGMECAIDPSDPNIMYASTQNGNIMRSIAGGKDWKGIRPESGGSWITPFQIHPINTNMLVAGYKSVYLSTSWGNSWTKISPELDGGGTMNEISFAPSDNAWIYVSRGAKIWGTRDRGASWISLNNGLPNLSIEWIVVSPSEPEKVWVAFSGFTAGEKVYYSDSGGDSWVNYSEGLPNVPTNCLFINKMSNYAMYAGTDLGVYYRNPAMSEWVPFDDGLPNVIVNVLDINYKVNKIRAATFGRGIWESPIIDDGRREPALQLTAEGRTSQIVLSWIAPKEVQPLGYNIYRDDTLLLTSPTNGYTDQVANGLSHSYRVEAVYADGVSTPTNRVVARTPVEVTFPYREDFEEVTHGWLLKKDPSGWQWGTGSDFKLNQLGSSKFIAVSSELAGVAGKRASDYAILPQMDLVGLDNPIISCKYAFRRWQNFDRLYLVYRTEENPLWTNLIEIEPSSRTLWTWRTFTFTIPTDLLIPGIEFAFYYTDSGSLGYGAAIDDFYIGPETSGVGKTTLDGQVTLYPNPTHGEFNVSLKGLQGQEVQVDILDAGGRMIQQQVIRVETPETTRSLDLGSAGRGLYFVRVTGKDHQWVLPLTNNR
ncbi:MAG: T9SS type A sorting domain-containing protein [Bacteroidales bacterium]